jgi:protein-disulfide isomerase
MASRTKQKEEARARRLAEERAQAERAQRQRRLAMLGGVVLAAVAIVAVAIAISSGGSSSNSSAAAASPRTPQQQAQRTKVNTQVNSLLAGIPQSGNRLGSPKAPVTVTEYGDLQCPICRDFALSSENQLIANEVRSGKVQLVYRSLETATQDPSVFATQQAAALAAGQQNKAWYFIELFYHEQGQEGTGYVTPTYLNNLALQVPGLNFSSWQSQSKNPTLAAQVQADEQSAQGQGFNSTPTITIRGPKGAAQPIVGPPSYSSLQSQINSVR